MKTVSISFLSVFSGGLIRAMPAIGQAPAVDLIKEGTALAVMGTAFLMVLQWMLKSQSRHMRKIEKAQHVSALAQINVEAKLLSLQAQLMAHDLTITGLNPSAGADFEDRDSKALAKYNEVQKQIMEQMSALTDLRHVVEAHLRSTPE